ncbi:hypothetical protein R3P38DRAFT_3295017 [Favolaschia claudopus]|uniref:Uncharacterized protein n=1 Tax=Favolaschia claudopus TaxID=2862362 RepID=A0AAV9ZCA6_9AGAR
MLITSLLFKTPCAPSPPFSVHTDLSSFICIHPATPPTPPLRIPPSPALLLQPSLALTGPSHLSADRLPAVCVIGTEFVLILPPPPPLFCGRNRARRCIAPVNVNGHGLASYTARERWSVGGWPGCEAVGARSTFSLWVAAASGSPSAPPYPFTFGTGSAHTDALSFPSSRLSVLATTHGWQEAEAGFHGRSEMDNDLAGSRSELRSATSGAGEPHGARCYDSSVCAARRVGGPRHTIFVYIQHWHEGRVDPATSTVADGLRVLGDAFDADAETTTLHGAFDGGIDLAF